MLWRFAKILLHPELQTAAKTYVSVARSPQVGISKVKWHRALSTRTHTETTGGVRNPPGSSQSDEPRRM